MLFSIFLRFSPAFIKSNDTSRCRGSNERISVDNFIQGKHIRNIFKQSPPLRLNNMVVKNM